MAASATLTPPPAWTTDQVLRITGISRRRLAYWLDKKIVTADVDEARGRGRVRLWSFSNMVEVRVALWLRDRVSLQLIGKIVGKLRNQGIHQPLAEVRFAVIDTGKPKRPTDVVIQLPDGAWEAPIAGQIVMEVVLPLQRFAEEMTRSAERDRAHRRQAGQTSKHRGRLGSTEVFAGTRVPVATVRHLVDANWPVERILDNYPGLTRRDVIAAAGGKAVG